MCCQLLYYFILSIRIFEKNSILFYIFLCYVSFFLLLLFIPKTWIIKICGSFSLCVCAFFLFHLRICVFFLFWLYKKQITNNLYQTRQDTTRQDKTGLLHCAFFLFFFQKTFLFYYKHFLYIFLSPVHVIWYAQQQSTMVEICLNKYFILLCFFFIKT